MRLLLAIAAVSACVTPGPGPAAPPKGTPAPAPPAGADAAATPAVLAPPRPAGRVLLVSGGAERWLGPDEAAAAGFTLVDLSDDWTPWIFAEHRTADGRELPNRYRRVFVGLANDRLDEDGQALPPGRKNYLELYGVPPSLSVLRARFFESADRSCASDTSRPGRPRSPEAAALVEAARRLTCEGFDPGGRHRRATLDDPLRHAIRRFQKKHMIYEGHYGLGPRSGEALGRSLLENDHRALLRVLRERVVSAAGVIEDGSAAVKGEPPRYLTAQAERRPVPNLADEYTEEAARQIGLSTPEDALAFFRRRTEGDFGRLYAAVKLPPVPEYYEGFLDLSVVIDRGDVFYDLPFDQTGAYKPHPRKKYPHFILFLKHRGQRIPLVRWRTTVGGWRAEQASDGYEYFRYKGSDVGPRVIRQVIAGPVWIAPASTPIRSLTKVKQVRTRREVVVNYDELGPGYLSAYGLVAGYVVTPGQYGRPDFDNGIRIHGSAEYLSMYSTVGFSHGCHRLPNHLALRLYSFLLRRRPMSVQGDLAIDFARQFLKGDDVFEIRVPSRGYAFRLDPPLPVDVLEGEIKGEVKTPILTYVPKPGVRYPGPPPPVPDSPEARAGAASADRTETESKDPVEVAPEARP